MTQTSKRLTAYQKDEILHSMIEIRLETILDDPSSADDFETEASLEELRRKIENDVMDFTPQEIKWLESEIDNRIQTGDSNRDHEGFKVQSFINSLNNAKDKIGII